MRCIVEPSVGDPWDFPAVHVLGDLHVNSTTYMYMCSAVPFGTGCLIHPVVGYS